MLTRVGLTVLVTLIVAPATRATSGLEVLTANQRVLAIAAIGGQNGIVQTRTLAMTHVAIHDALNTVDPRYERYAYAGPALPGGSPEAAIAAALHDVLAGVIPSFGTAAQQAAALLETDTDYAASLALIPDGAAKADGVTAGQAAAAAILARRTGDGATVANIPYAPPTGPGFWLPTPNPTPSNPPGVASFLPANLPGWGNVTPFALNDATQFRPDGPPPLDSAEYAVDYNEVKSIGAQFSASRTEEQSEIARFWYEGSHAGWNRIARTVATARGLDLWQQARLLGLVNISIADGFIAGWDIRFHYHFWRPVTAIRAGDTDGNPDTDADPGWNTYLNTPPIPDYASTHSALGAAAAEVLARFFGDDNIAFDTTSGAPFAGITRHFSSFSQAARENADSRVYAGIHFRTACRDGLKLGGKIGKFTVGHVLEPLQGHHD
jgi:hypothetical protein